MRNFSILGAAVALTLALPAGATVINFDTLPGGGTLPIGGTTISTQYASLGVTFSANNTVNGTTGSPNAWGYLPATGPGGSGNSLGNFGVITPSPVPGPSDYLTAPRYNFVTLTFDGTASGVSFGLYTGGGQNTVNIVALNSLGVALQTLSNVAANNGIYDITSLSASGIAKITIEGGFFSPGGSAKIFFIDNLTYTLTPAAGAVPEPASWAMMIGGLGLTGAAMRRRKVRVAIA